MSRSSAIALSALALSAAIPAGALETRTVRLEIAATEPFAVENLVGTMKIRPGSGGAAVAVATLHAESAELLAAMTFEQVKDDHGRPALRVRYPESERRVRSPHLPGASKKGEPEGFFARLFGSGHSTVDYDGRRITVSDREGVELWAEVEIELPRRAVEARFENAVGGLSADGVEGRLSFEVASGAVSLNGTRGEIKAGTGSGDIAAVQVAGKMHGSTGSGDCAVTGFEGDDVTCSTGSGDVAMRSIKAREISAETGSGDVRIESTEGDRVAASTGSGEIELSAVSALKLKLDTGSGDVRVLAADVREFDADTGSGDVLLESRSSRLDRVSVDTGSGNVRLRLGASASFVARADSNGDLTSGFSDAEAIVKGREIVGYRRGDGQARIDVSTGSGDVRLEE